MRALRFDRLLTTTALALALAAGSGFPAHAGMTEAGISAAVPMPEPANLPPPTALDVGAKPVQASLTPAEIEARIPLPESANLPPPSINDLGPATTGTTSTPNPKDITAPPPAAAPVETAAPPPAAAPVDTAAPQPAAAPVEDPIAVAMRAFLTTKLSRLVERKNERTAIEQFYAKRGFAPLWLENGEPSARAKAAIRYLAAVDEEGLDPTDYPTPVFRSGADPAALVEADVRLTDAVLTFARHAQSGRVHWTRVSADVFYGHAAPEPADILAQIADAKDLGATLADFNPPHAGYKALKAKLAEVRGRSTAATEEMVRVPEGPLLRPGATDPRVPALRKRLKVTSDPDSQRYDEDVAEAVKAFQKSHGLSPDGLIGAGTVRALNGGQPRSTARDADIILANMERWRWLPRELGNSQDAYVVLNIPDYTLRVHHKGQIAWQTRVVVGATKTPTPILTETMKYITVNPTWNVPPSIVYNEYLPALQQDPTVLQRMGLRLSQNADGSVHISQPPGERNALGRIRFNFPNRFLVYQHDTPDKHLFAHDKRAYSHGCMRVQDPARYAEVLLSIARPNDGYTQDRIKKMFGNSEIDIQLPVHIPVHITYQTAFVDDAGKLVIRDDVYGRDARVLAALKGEERRVADVPMERPKQSYARPSVRLPYGVADAYGNTGPSFFDMLFGGSQPQQRPAARTSNQQRRATFSR